MFCCPLVLAQKKHSFFLEIYGEPARTRGLSQCGNFADRGGRFFAILGGRFLWAKCVYLSLFLTKRIYLRMEL